ncbi:MAG: type II toxin-antitoxin system RelE/ParE family toxin [Tannerellaceae bacterium]|jgi:plasmid stabilization system protein ParE|nr:type II toxin-antitoxin system RelE/ParE family toxin [Tannerellaceae bacterium]
MKKRKVCITPEALRDIERLYDYIAYELLEPFTAQKYSEGVFDAIKELHRLGEALAVNQREYLQRFYGPDVRTTNYKKVTIVFNIVGNVILIRRVIAGGLVR